MKQADIFVESEGDAWLERNRDKLGERDPVSEVIESLRIKPKRALEVGCANGWRLAALRDKYGCDVQGVEPSRQAATEAAQRHVPVYQATAERLPLADDSFDVVIYGFALYLCDPADWLRIAAEGDRVLADGGHLIIHDFLAGINPVARRYEHRDGVMSFHFDFVQLWLVHPWYRIIRRRIINENEMVVALTKRSVCEIVP